MRKNVVGINGGNKEGDKNGLNKNKDGNMKGEVSDNSKIGINKESDDNDDSWEKIDMEQDKFGKKGKDKSKLPRIDNKGDLKFSDENVDEIDKENCAMGNNESWVF